MLFTKTGPVHVHDAELYLSRLAHQKFLIWLRHPEDLYSHVRKLQGYPLKTPYGALAIWHIKLLVLQSVCSSR